MNVIRSGREALKRALAELGTAGRDATAIWRAANARSAIWRWRRNLSALDYFGEVPWAEFPAAAEWYVRMKSRPSFRSLLADRVPGQPPVSHYAELDF